MAKHWLKSRISPTVDLDTITVHLRHDVPVPTVELGGRVLAADHKARAVSRATITTAHLTPAGATFIEEMKAMFGGAAVTAKEATD